MALRLGPTGGGVSYELDPRCAHRAAVERTCDYRPPHYFDDEGRVHVIVMVRARDIECADCGGDVHELWRAMKPQPPMVERRPRCTRPACDCFTPDEWVHITTRPCWGGEAIPPERLP